MRRILIFGPSLIGSHFKNYFRTNPEISSYLSEIDLTDQLVVRITLKETKPDVVIDSNVVTPDILIQECVRKELLLIHLSDDTVLSDYEIQSGKIEILALRMAIAECIKQYAPPSQNK